MTTGLAAPVASALVQVDVYTAVGGDQFFFDLVDRFYRRVETDPVLRPLYPDDITPSRRHLALFLIQYWGGPQTYSEQRGHPRLRMRHFPFPIGPAERDAWLEAMSASLAEAELERSLEARFVEYFAMAADHLVNVSG